MGLAGTNHMFDKQDFKELLKQLEEGKSVISFTSFMGARKLFYIRPYAEYVALQLRNKIQLQTTHTFTYFEDLKDDHELNIEYIASLLSKFNFDANSIYNQRNVVIWYLKEKTKDPKYNLEMIGGYYEFRDKIFSHYMKRVLNNEESDFEDTPVNVWLSSAIENEYLKKILSESEMNKLRVLVMLR
jgi:hypothetical protein